jgi:hypothetical protein
MLDLSKIFEDGRFKHYGRRKYFGAVDGDKIGVVLATKNAGYGTCALNKAEFDAVLRAKSEGKITGAYIVAANVSGSAPKFFDQIDAEQLAAKLANEVPMVGRFGEFFVLPSGIGFPASTDDDEPF